MAASSRGGDRLTEGNTLPGAGALAAAPGPSVGSGFLGLRVAGFVFQQRKNSAVVCTARWDQCLQNGGFR